MKTTDKDGNNVEISERDFLWNVIYYFGIAYEKKDYLFFSRSGDCDGVRLTGKELSKLCKQLRKNIYSMYEKTN